MYVSGLDADGQTFPDASQAGLERSLHFDPASPMSSPTCFGQSLNRSGMAAIYSNYPEQILRCWLARPAKTNAAAEDVSEIADPSEPRPADGAGSAPVNRQRDRLGGSGQDDVLKGKSRDDILIGRGGHDRLLGKAGDDRLLGRSGRDQLLGGRGNDQLWGGSGADEMLGGAGQDTLTGGNGRDLFVLQGGGGGRSPRRADVITDFRDGVDQLRLEAVEFSNLDISQGSGRHAADTVIRDRTTGQILVVIQNLNSELITIEDVANAAVTNPPPEAGSPGETSLMEENTPPVEAPADATTPLPPANDAGAPAEAPGEALQGGGTSDTQIGDRPAGEAPANDGPTNDHSSTAPPTNDPSASTPPGSDPPTTDPPASDPPASDPPASDPPASDPPASDPPASDPPASDPPVTVPIASVGEGLNFNGVNLSDEAAVQAIGSPALTVGDRTVYIGYRQVAGNNQNPIVLSFNSQNPSQNWSRTDYEVTGADSRGYGLFWSGTDLYGVFSIDGAQGQPSEDFRRASNDATQSWLRSYGSGGGAKIAVIARLDLATGDLLDAAHLSALLSNGRSNSLVIEDIEVNADGNLVIHAQSYFSPRRPNGSAMTQASSDGSPFDYTVEITPDLKQVVSTAADGWT